MRGGNKFRTPHKLKKNATLRLPQYMGFFDTETYQDIDKHGRRIHKLKLGWFCSVYKKPNKDGYYQKWFYFENNNQFWDYLLSLIPKKSKMVLFAHNTDFDFGVTEGYKMLDERGFKIEKPIIDANRFICKFTNNGRSLLVLDTLNYFKTSLKGLGESIGIGKMDIDFDNCSTEYLSKYCKNDVMITKEAVLKMVEFMRVQDLGNFKPTIAGISFNAFCHRFMGDDIMIHTNPKAINLERESYRGGRTEAFYIGEISDRKIYKLDINSLYPYVMKINNYPTKLVKYIDNGTLNGLMRGLKRFLMVARVNITIDKPFIPYKTERLIFPVGTFTVTLNTPELKEVIKYGKINKVYDYTIYEYNNIFNSYVDTFYKLRLEYKKAGDIAFSTFCKYLLNSLYGKFGQRVKKFTEIGKTDENDKVENVIDAESNKFYQLFYISGKVYKAESDFIEGYNSFVAISSHVTSYARLLIWNMIKSIPDKHLYYVDTDSFFVDNIGKDALSSFIDENKLGFLKIEDTTNNLIIRNLKDYSWDGERHTKGIKNNAKIITNCGECIIKDRCKTLKTNDFKGLSECFEQTQFPKFRTRIRKNELNHVHDKQIVKRLSNKYHKGVVNNDGFITPLSINDIN